MTPLLEFRLIEMLRILDNYHVYLEEILDETPERIENAIDNLSEAMTEKLKEMK